MRARADGLLGRLAIAARTAPPFLRVTVSPRAARWLVAAGARRGTSADAMEVRFPGQSQDAGRFEREKLLLRISSFELALRIGDDADHLLALRSFNEASEAIRARFPGPSALPEEYADLIRLVEALNHSRAIMTEQDSLPPDLPDGVKDILREVLIEGTGRSEKYSGKGSGTDEVLVGTVRRAVELAEGLASAGGFRAPQRVRSLVATIAAAVKLATRELDVDLSDLDVREIAVPALSALYGVIWNTRTRWPESALPNVRRNSSPIGAGTFRIGLEGQPTREDTFA